MAARARNLALPPPGLSTLLDLYGASALDAPSAPPCTPKPPHLAAVRQILEQRRHAQARNRRRSPWRCPKTQLRDIVVHPHDLGTYDQIHTENSDDDTDNA